ncbi:MAG TPA: DUF3303 family protein [Candidatus Baltobacteraceae bacterium]|nr:DUF3303 family protein [Candidatus Baltobacteraceae bacterium]
MLFLIVERFKSGRERAIHERFTRHGRLMPDGVAYRASWIDPASARCFQIVEAVSRERVEEWTRRWHDLIAFEVIPIEEPAEYWARIAGAPPP